MPVNKIVRVQTTGADVIHSFAVPAFGIKIDAIPGRLNETWFKATKTGMVLWPVLGAVRQGSCLHADRGPHVVSDQEFATWVEAAQKKYASAPGQYLRGGDRHGRAIGSRNKRAG